MQLPKKIRVTEVCPRDGLQNIPSFIDTDKKVELIREMVDAGVDEIEVTSFVHPKFVPQFKDASEVFSKVKEYAESKGTRLIALVPNLKGAINAKASGLDTINCVMSASEAHNKRNVNKSVEESLADIRQIIHEVQGVEIRLALACAFGSPFDDEVPISQVRRICKEVFSLGVKWIGLADSAGVSTPVNTRKIIKALKEDFPVESFSVHLHDTRGMGIANAYVALEEGVTNFDASLGGLGGCPFIPGARGNVASEDFINMISSMGIRTGYDLEKMMAICKKLPLLTNQPITSNMMSCMQCSQIAQ